MRPRWPWAAVAGAATLAVVPSDAGLVERWFSSGVYPRLQPVITGLSNQTPVALLDVLIGLVLVGVAAAAAHVVRARGRRLRAAAGAILRLAGIAALLYVAFVLVWGLNYRRVPMTDRLVMGEPPDTTAVTAFARRVVGRVNALHGPAHQLVWSSDEWRNPQLRAAFARTQRLLTAAPPAEPGRLKTTLLGPYFRWTSVDGMINPLGLEVLVNPDLLPFERPFVAAHEWAHLAGFADEADANFVGWLTCVRADVASRYSGWLFLYWQLRGDVAPSVRAALDRELAPGPRADLSAIAARLQRGQLPPLRRASWAVYDQYLKANRVEEGVRSYGGVVALVLRARFDDDWVPARRDVR